MTMYSSMLSPDLVEQGVADGGGDIAAALAPAGNDIGRAAALDDQLLALDHVHEADRHADQQRGPEQLRRHERVERHQRRRRVADGEDAGLFELRGLLHRDPGAGHAARLCLGRDVGVGHEAVDLAAEGGEDALVDPGLRHLGIGDDIAAGPQGFEPCLHGVGREDEVVGVVKVRGGVDGALDDRRVFRVELPVAQKLGDDLEAARFDVYGSAGLKHGGASPFGRRIENSRRRPDSRKSGNVGSPHRASRSRGRRASGGGYWETLKKVPDVWSIGYGGLTFRLKPMGFKHTGLFPEQAVNWDRMMKLIESAGRKINVLNLFGYTGAASVACLKEGASVVHVDASKGMTNWAKENAQASGVADGDVRWIVDDCIKFVKREQRRENKYDIIILDPPSYGRGPKGEIWHLEECLYDFMLEVEKVLSDKPIAVILNSYTTGLSASVMKYILDDVITSKHGGSVEADEIGLPVTANGGVLPCGTTAIWKA